MIRRLGQRAATGLAGIALAWSGAIGGLSAASGAEPQVGFLKIEGALAERDASPASLLGGAGEPTLRAVIDALDRAGRTSLRGVVIRLAEPQLERAQVEELGGAISRLRARGQKVHVFTEIYGPAELLLGSYADEVIVQSGGAVSLPGLYAEEMFLADALRQWGVSPDFVQIGDYKGASEMLGNSAPSPAWDQNINQLLDSVWGLTLSRLKDGRSLTDAQLEEAMKQAFLADPERARGLGLVDAVVDRLALDEHLEQTYGEGFDYDMTLSPGTASADLAQLGFFEMFSQLMRAVEGAQSQTSTDTIAVLHIDGPIIDGESRPAGFMQGASVGSLTIRQVLRDLEDDANVKGVILRINSPGGSAIASESIWLGVRRLAAMKPVWTSVGSMAASGGYYIAVAGDRIFVNPSSIVGSIGVVGGKLAMGGLYEKLKVNVVARSRGPRAGIMGGLTPWTDEERSLVRQRMSEVYDQFVARVRTGREGIDINQTAEGRLFTGVRAVELKMADDLGGLHGAIDAMAQELSLGEGAFEVRDYPPPPSLEELLKGVFPMGAAAGLSAPAGDGAVVGALRELVGPRAWKQIQSGLTALLQLRREPVLLVHPSVIIER